MNDCNTAHNERLQQVTAEATAKALAQPPMPSKAVRNKITAEQAYHTAVNALCDKIVEGHTQSHILGPLVDKVHEAMEWADTCKSAAIKELSVEKP